MWSNESYVSTDILHVMDVEICYSNKALCECILNNVPRLNNASLIREIGQDWK